MTQIGTIFSSPTNPYCLLLIAYCLLQHRAPAREFPFAAFIDEGERGPV